ncbi:MAG TPA: ABC transporter ATP-binding protein [Chloroflexota bacterium]
MNIAARLISYYRRFWGALALGFFCLFCVTGIELTVPELIRRVIDCGIRAGFSAYDPHTACPSGVSPLSLVAGAALLIVVLTFVKGVFLFGQSYLGEYGAQHVAYDVRNDIYRHLQRLPFSWHDQVQTGQIMSRATSDVEQLRFFTGRALLQLGQLIILGVGISLVLFATNWKLTLAALVVVPMLLRTVDAYQQAIRPVFSQAQQELAVLASIVQENLAGARVVKAFAREGDEIRKFHEQNERLQDQYLGAAEYQSFLNPLMDALGNLCTGIVLWYGGYLVINGELTVGQLVAFNTYLLLIVRPVRRLGFLVGQGSQALAAGERIFQVLDAAVDLEDKPGAVPMPPIHGHVVFDHVSCSYYGGVPALRDVSFEAQPGQVVALVGGSGSGKTSTINLVPRFYDVSEGRVLIDGLDVRDVQIESLRRQIGIVLQDTMLFTGTIRENIALGKPGASEDEIVAAAMAARADPFIREFPTGYETAVGERGVTLSGGQKQRIAIARALLLDPRILILDDFTSAVDTETEAMIRQALQVLMKDRTTLVIAQRVGTVQNADMIVVLDQGEVVGMGTHEELLETNAIYSEIYQLQLTDEPLSAVPSPSASMLEAANGVAGTPRPGRPELVEG